MKKISIIIITLFVTCNTYLFAEQPYVGEIQIFGGNFPPMNWSICDGKLLVISENEALFQLIGTTYGGDGETTFALPDLRGRIPIHQGQGPGTSYYSLGEKAGVETVTLTTAQMPLHSHLITVNLPVSASLGDRDTPENNYLTVNPSRGSEFSSNGANAVMAPVLNISGNSDNTGGNQAHENRMPYLAVTYIICLQGVFPPR